MEAVSALNQTDEHRTTGEGTQEEEMQSRPQTASFSVASIAISILALILGIVGGLLASVATNSEWKGKIEQRIQTLENQRTEDKETWNIIRTQNEVNGKALAGIDAMLKAQQSDRRR